MRRIAIKTTSFLLATMLCWGTELTCYARPADTLDGRTYAAETMLISQDSLNNAGHVLDVIPAVNGGRVGTIGTADITDTTRQCINDVIAKYSNTKHSVSFVMMDLATGRALYYNTALSVYSASCIKGPYIVACLAAGNDATNDMYLAGHDSDNEAYRRLRKTYGKALFMQWLRSIGVDSAKGMWNYCNLTSLELARMWLAMYPYILGNESGSASARQILQGSKNSVIEAGPGTTRTVYSKAGWIAPDVRADLHSYNVGGIVMDEYPYIVAITSDVSGGTNEAQELITLLDIAHEEMISDLIGAGMHNAADLAAQAAAEAALAEQQAAEDDAAATADTTLQTTPQTSTDPLTNLLPETPATEKRDIIWSPTPSITITPAQNSTR